jgi:regulator of cell morphogenesis and NO signaling
MTSREIHLNPITIKPNGMLNNFSGSIVDIVNGDYRTAEVFKKYSINFCCGGQVSLIDTCKQRNIDYDNMIEELKWATRNIVVSNDLPFELWEPDFLIDYITHLHHIYIYQNVPVLEPEFNSFVVSHERNFPEIIKVQATFKKLCSLLLVHSKHEDEVIFPYIKQCCAAFRHKETYGNLFVRTLRKPFNHIQSEHAEIEKLASELKELTHQFTPPVKACTKHQILYKKLNDFHDNLIQHKYLETNLLYPQAIGIENQLLQT